MSNQRACLAAVPDLAAALRHHAAGIDAHFAAVDLLIEHGIFLGRAAFREEFVRVVRYTPSCAHTYGAYVRWGAAITALNQHRLPCSSSEADILRIAASLGANIPVRLGRLLGVLDTTNIGRVIDAITLANGSRIHRCPTPQGQS
jgi:hypothetical protein